MLRHHRGVTSRWLTRAPLTAVTVVALAAAALQGCSEGHGTRDVSTAAGIASARSQLEGCKAFAARRPGRPPVIDVQDVTVGQMRAMLRQLAPRRAEPWPGQPALQHATLCVLEPLNPAAAPPQPLPSCPPGQFPAVVSWYLSRSSFVLSPSRAYRLGLVGPAGHDGEAPCLH